MVYFANKLKILLIKLEIIFIKGDKRSCYCNSAPMAALCQLVGEIVLLLLLNTSVV